MVNAAGIVTIEQGEKQFSVTWNLYAKKEVWIGGLEIRRKTLHLEIEKRKTEIRILGKNKELRRINRSK